MTKHHTPVMPGEQHHMNGPWARTTTLARVSQNIICAMQVVSNSAKAAEADHSPGSLRAAGSAHRDMGGRNTHDCRGDARWMLLSGRRLSAGGSEVQ